MKFKTLFYILIGYISSCGRIPEMKEINSENLKILDSVRNYLQCKNIEHSYLSKGNLNHQDLFFVVNIYDVKRKKINFDSLNVRILDVYQKSGYDFGVCKKIGIYYINDYKNADLRKVYYFDKNLEVIEIAYD